MFSAFAVRKASSNSDFANTRNSSGYTDFDQIQVERYYLQFFLFSPNAMFGLCFVPVFVNLPFELKKKI